MIFVIYVYSMLYTIDYVLYDRTIGTVHTYCLSFSPLLLLLIVIYDGVGSYNETTIVDWYVHDDNVGLCEPSC